MNENLQLYIIINVNLYNLKNVFFQLLKKLLKIEIQNRHKIIFKIIIFIFFKLKKTKIKYYITKKKNLMIIKCLIEIKYFIIKYRYFIILYTNY